MSPDGHIYTPEQVDDAKTRAPQFAGTLIELSDDEAHELSMLNRKDRRKRLREMRRKQRKAA